MYLLLIYFVTTATPFTVALRCHENFTMLTSTKCIQYFDERKTWNDAESFCQSDHDGNLVSVHSLAESDVIETLLPATFSSTYNEDDDVWIGLSDITTEGTPMWSDGTQVDYTRYTSGEPNDGCGLCGATGSADCFRMNPDGSTQEAPAWEWGDKQCNLQARFVCQRPPIGLKVTTLHVDISHTSLNTRGTSRDHLQCARGCAHGGNCLQVQMEDDLTCSQSDQRFAITGRPVWEVKSVVEN